MKVCGFTIIRNAIKYSYPVIESIKSILPLCDQMVVAVGKSDDETLNLIKSINDEKIVIVDTVWDDSLRKDGLVLSVETNKALDAIVGEYDWCFYIQADEVLHEKYHPVIKAEMERWANDKNVEGLLFKYLHFWGTFDYVGVSRKWYRREIRIVRHDSRIRSYKDAQGFRKDDRKLNVKLIDAYIYHYGWVRPPEVIMNKMRNFHTYYHTGQDLEAVVSKVDDFDYSRIDAVRSFGDTHPKVMEDLVKSLNWHVEIDESKFKFNLKDTILYWFEKNFGYRLFEYKNYKII